MNMVVGGDGDRILASSIMFVIIVLFFWFNVQKKLLVFMCSHLEYESIVMMSLHAYIYMDMGLHSLTRFYIISHISEVNCYLYAEYVVFI